jgi:hypothetical protein
MWIICHSLKQLPIVCGTRGFITMITGAQTDSPYCSSIRFSIVLPSVSSLSKWIFSLQFVIRHFCQCREACHQIVQLLVVICCVLSCTQHRENRCVTNLSPHTCQCVMCEDCGTICACDSDSYFCIFFYLNNMNCVSFLSGRAYTHR